MNDVLRVYDTSGNPLTGVVDLNTFYGYAAAIVRPSTFGPEITDPSCYFDPDTQRWFVVVLTLDRAGTTSSLAGTNHLDIAVSQTSSPLGLFNIYRLPVQDDGTQGTPNHGCVRRTRTGLVPGPCFGDYPHIGADANGFYMTTNEFNFFAPGFRASQIYAISKQALAAGAASVTAFQFDTAGFLLDGLPGFTVWPATTPVSAYATDAGGTEYLLSSVAVFSGTANSIRIWGLSNTQSLNTASPTLALNSSDIAVNTYGVPPKADQKAGDFPLGQCFNNSACSTFLIGFADPFTETESNHVDANDSRMQQVVYANGKLWGALDTAVTLATTSGSQTKAGIAYFVIQPASTPTSATGSIIVQGALGLADNNLSYPAVGVTDSGRGVIAFTLLGAGGTTNPGNFPTAAYASLDAHIGAGPILIAATGLGPEDGFTAYRIEVGGGRNRWGDYGAAVADGDKTIWIASEYIGQTCTLAQYESAPFGSCAGTRTSLGNWGTRITKLGM